MAQPFGVLLTHNLTLTLDPADSHSYVFQGNTQSLDHVPVNDAAAVTYKVAGRPAFTPRRGR